MRASDEPRTAAAQRALEPNRGRRADTPTAIPWRGWKDIFWRTYEEISADRLLLIAAGVVFYAMLAMVPAITALVSMYGMFAKASSINEHLNFLAGVMPAGAYAADQRADRAHRGNSDGKLTFAFLLGLGLAVWSANAGMKAIFDALNIVYDEDEKRSFIKLNLISLCFHVRRGRRAAAGARCGRGASRWCLRISASRRNSRPDCCRCCAGPRCSCW